MLTFDTLDIKDNIKAVLSKYSVDFAFQPIFSRNRELIGYEALMRPVGKNILDFIEEMKDAGELHELELLSFFGATKAYKERNYTEMLSINSFPSEAFTKEEALEYSLCFRPIKEKLIIEILEYTEEKHWTWNAKREHIEEYKGIEVALDDYGTGSNDINAVDYYSPHMIKLDRSLIFDIDKDAVKQTKIKEIIKTMHNRAVVVLAEGIETKEEHDWLMQAGVDFFQGYYLGRPN